MNRHGLTYIDLHPQPIEREPSRLRIWLGAAFCLAAVFAGLHLITLIPCA